MSALACRTEANEPSGALLIAGLFDVDELLSPRDEGRVAFSISPIDRPHPRLPGHDLVPIVASLVIIDARGPHT